MENNSAYFTISMWPKQGMDERFGWIDTIVLMVCKNSKEMLVEKFSEKNVKRSVLYGF